MATAPSQPDYTPEEYLAIERAAEYKSEYIDGHIVAGAPFGPGASREHNLITVNVGSELSRQLKDTPSEAYVSRMRVKTDKTGLYTYPDVVVVCGRPQFEDAQVDTRLNPTVIVEVLSRSTEAYDRGEKFRRYRELPSLREYLLIAQDSVGVDHYLRQADQWVISDVRRIGDLVRLPSIDCSLAINEIYDKIEFLPPVPDPPNRT